MEPDSKKSFTPGVTEAALAFVQEKERSTTVGPKGAVGLKENMKVCAPPAAILTGVLGVPVSAFVEGLVV